MEEKKITIDDVSFYFKKINNLEKEQDALRKQAEREIERIEAWLSKELAPLQSKISYYSGEILRYHAEEKAKNPRVKITTPYGKVVSRKTSKWIYTNEQEIIDYCNMNEIDCIRVVEELDKTLLKKICAGGVNQETGEIIPGVKIEEIETINLKLEE